MSTNHTPDLNAYIPSEEEIAASTSAMLAEADRSRRPFVEVVDTEVHGPEGDLFVQTLRIKASRLISRREAEVTLRAGFQVLKDTKVSQKVCRRRRRLGLDDSHSASFDEDVD